MGNPQETPAPPADSTPASSREADCRKMREEYIARRDAAPGICTVDSDCENVPGGVDDCGCVIDVQTARAIAPLYEANVRRCGISVDCAPRISIPRCREGRCVRARQ